MQLNTTHPTRIRCGLKALLYSTLLTITLAWLIPEPAWADLTSAFDEVHTQVKTYSFKGIRIAEVLSLLIGFGLSAWKHTAGPVITAGGSIAAVEIGKAFLNSLQS